ncbi:MULTISPECIES: hypothetical protein [unclassified Variovorax]|uniref:hypothetical protein n=1 Tax=unclassified Variovorax TaxID=663243 RepID=UPI001BD2980E|nr:MULTISPECIES: hypothetical protein [unclassified Variovorax]
MDVDLYRSITDRNKYLAVPAGLSTAAFEFPAHDDLANLVVYKLRHRFNPDAVYGGVNAADIARQIEANGFAVFRE